MTRLRLRTLIRKGLGETTAAFWTDAELNTLIDEACDDLAYRTKCIRANTTVSSVANTAEYSLSTNISNALAPLEVYFRQDGNTWRKLDSTNREELSAEHPGWMSVSSSTPTMWYWDREEDKYGFFPPPNSTNAGTYVKVYYASKHTDINDDATEPDIPTYLQPAIVDYCIASGKEQRGLGDQGYWQKYYAKIHDYRVERHREREDDILIMRNYR